MCSQVYETIFNSFITLILVSKRFEPWNPIFKLFWTKIDSIDYTLLLNRKYIDNRIQTIKIDELTFQYMFPSLRNDIQFIHNINTGLKKI